MADVCLWVCAGAGLLIVLAVGAIGGTALFFAAASWFEVGRDFRTFRADWNTYGMWRAGEIHKANAGIRRRVFGSHGVNNGENRPT